MRRIAQIGAGIAELFADPIVRMRIGSLTTEAINEAAAQSQVKINRGSWTVAMLRDDDLGTVVERLGALRPPRRLRELLADVDPVEQNRVPLPAGSVASTAPAAASADPQAHATATAAATSAPMVGRTAATTATARVPSAAAAATSPMTSAAAAATAASRCKSYAAGAKLSRALSGTRYTARRCLRTSGWKPSELLKRPDEPAGGARPLRQTCPG